MANDGGVWVKLEDAGSSAPGAAVINDASSNYDNKDAGVTIDGKTYDIYTFTTATTTRSMRLTDEARARITDEDLLMAVATTPIPDDFTGDPVELFDEKYRNQLRNAFEIAPAVDPGLTLDVATAGFADVLLIGGGGGGGSWAAGGGGGGAFLENYTLLPAENLTVVVGSGGLGGYSGYPTHNGLNGNPTALDSVGVALGGGGGGAYSDGTPTPGYVGNGGGAGYEQSNIYVAGGVGFFGYNGGASQVGTAGGGGGGAGGVGSDSNGDIGGNGGPGKSSNITGSPVTYAGGGGGAAQGSATPGSGGIGGGADGVGNTVQTGNNGTPNTGGGGGGTRNQSDTAGARGGDGGSGIVIVRVEI